MNGQDFERLANYTAEVHRGIVHTEEYVGEMELLQAKFDSEDTYNIDKEVA